MKTKFVYILLNVICFSYVDFSIACPEGQHSVCEYDPNKGKIVCKCVETKKETSEPN
jgi:hypothetical protein